MDQQSNYEIKIVLIGIEKVGKSSILTKYIENIFLTHYTPTIAVDFRTKILNIEENKSIELQVWDIAGEKRFSRLTAMYQRGAHVILLIIDVTNLDSLTVVEKKVESIRNWTNSEVSIIVVGNKMDKIRERQFSYEIAQETALRLGVFYMEVSAYTGMNIYKVFDLSIREAMIKIKEILRDEIEHFYDFNLKKSFF